MRSYMVMVFTTTKEAFSQVSHRYLYSFLCIIFTCSFRLPLETYEHWHCGQANWLPWCIVLTCCNNCFLSLHSDAQCLHVYLEWSRMRRHPSRFGWVEEPLDDVNVKSAHIWPLSEYPAWPRLPVPSVDTWQAHKRFVISSLKISCLSSI